MVYMFLRCGKSCSCGWRIGFLLIPPRAAVLIKFESVPARVLANTPRWNLCVIHAGMTTHRQELNNTCQKCEEFCSTRACGQAMLKFMFKPRRQVETSTTLEQHTSEPATRSQLCRRRAGASEMMSAARCSEPFSARNVIGQLVHGRGNMLPTRHANLFGGAMLRSSWTPPPPPPPSSTIEK